jgi:phosphate transport system protein
MLTQKLNELKRQLIEYATLVENMIDKSIKGLIDKNKETLVEVIENDEPRANSRDKELDEECTVLIAQFEPLAKDLRTVLMIMKMVNDLERMADHSVNISESGLFLIARPLIRPLDDITKMAGVATKMLKDSISAFIKEDAALAKNVCERDNDVDDVGDKILKDIIAFMHREADGIKRSLHLIRISHNLERIADLSTNIAEEVVYMVEGRDIKHHDIQGHQDGGYHI